MTPATPAPGRRRFLQIAGGAIAMTALSSSVARAAQIAPRVRSGTIDDVEHIVILMQENRSFDHYFGSLRGVRGFGDPHPVSNNDTSIWSQDGILPFRPDRADLGLTFIEDLAHDWDSTHRAFNGGRYDQWVPAKGKATMAYCTRADIPFHYALADTFTICDNYHCSMLGPTDPNRYYLWSGYTGNDGAGGGPVLGNAEKGYSWQTYPERLDAAGVSWTIYQDIGDGLDAAGYWGWTYDPYIGNYGDNSLLYFDQYRNAVMTSSLYQKARTGTNVAKSGSYFDRIAEDAKNDALPRVSWVVAPEAFCEHPNWPANYGAWYVSQVLDALTANPEVWRKTALLIPYDENDGFFDHLVPPYPDRSTVSTEGEIYAGGGYPGGPYGLGPRVPMLVVSPWSRGGWVCSEVFDHTSVIRFIERRFGVSEPNISPWRRAICGDLTSAFDFGQRHPRVPALPSAAGYRPPDDKRHPSYIPVPPAAGTMPAQEPGVRPARALPYDLRAHGAGSGGTLTITFVSRGQAGAVFHVTSPDGPRSYTAGPGAALTGEFPVAGDVQVHGPNGFFRQFTGAGPDIIAVPGHQGLELRISNTAAASAELTVTDGYTGRARTLTVPAGTARTERVRTGDRHGWYDVSVTGTGYLRRLAGHLEDGRPSISDPALGRERGR